MRITSYFFDGRKKNKIERNYDIKLKKNIYSTVTIDECIRNFQRFTNCTLVEAIEAATLHPAELLGISDRKGTLNVGGDADFVFLDDSSGEIKVQRVYVAGDEVILN